MHRFQWSAIVFLVLALIFGAGSGLMEGLSHEKPEDSFFYWCGAVAAKLFTIAVVFVVACAIQWQKGEVS